MSGDYKVLASVYDKLGMSQYEVDMIPPLVTFAQRHEWMGRQILSLGCGTALGLRWLAQHSYIVSGVDQSPEMLKIAQQHYATLKLNIRWLQQDIRKLSDVSQADLVLALNVLNELDSLNDLEAVFKGVHQALRDQRLFIFDVYTLEGLLERFKRGEQTLLDTPEMLVFCKNHFDYERQTHKQHYTIFRKANADLWQRQETTLSIKAYGIQAMVGLLKRCGFQVAHVLNADLTPYDPNKSGVYKVILFAQKS